MPPRMPHDSGGHTGTATAADLLQLMFGDDLLGALGDAFRRNDFSRVGECPGERDTHAQLGATQPHAHVEASVLRHVTSRHVASRRGAVRCGGHPPPPYL